MTNDEIVVVLEQLMRSFNPGSEKSAYEELKDFQWSEIDNSSQSTAECKQSVLALLWEINPVRNAHEIIAKARCRLEFRQEPSTEYENGQTTNNRKRTVSCSEHDANQDTGSDNVAKPPPAKAQKKKGKQLPAIGPDQPKTAVDAYMSKMCKRKNIEQNAHTKAQWRELFNQLKPEKRFKFIDLAIKDELRYQREAEECGEPGFEKLSPFSQLSKKDLEYFVQSSGIEKPPTSGYNLFVTTGMQSVDCKSLTMSERMKFLGEKWKGLQDSEKLEYVQESKKLLADYKETLNSAPDEVIAVENFLRKNLTKNTPSTSSSTKGSNSVTPSTRNADGGKKKAKEIGTKEEKLSSTRIEFQTIDDSEDFESANSALSNHSLFNNVHQSTAVKSPQPPVKVQKSPKKKVTLATPEVTPKKRRRDRSSSSSIASVPL